MSTWPGTMFEDFDEEKIAATWESGFPPCPAALTPLAANYFKSHPEQEQMYVSATALGRLGDSTKDIGPVVTFLASDEGAYVTGQTINVDGGQMML